MWQRFTERARRVVFFGQEEAALLGENYVGTEHLLLGLVRESDSVAARVLDRLGVPQGRIRADIERQVTRGHGSLGQAMQLTPRAKRVIDLAYEEARALNNNYIGTEHLLIGLIAEGDGLAARVLVNLGADLERTRREVRALQEEDTASRTAGSPSAGTGIFEGFRERLRNLGHMVADLEKDLGSAARRLAGHETSSMPEGEREQAQWRLRQLVERWTQGPAPGNLAVRESLGVARKLCQGLTDFISIGDLDCLQAEALLCLA